MNFNFVKLMMTFELFYDILSIHIIFAYGIVSLMRRKVQFMAVSYNGLWKMLIDKNMYKKDLAEKLSIGSATLAKMGRGENVSMEILQKICEYMDCNIGDIVSFEKEGKGEKKEE